MKRSATVKPNLPVFLLLWGLSTWSFGQFESAPLINWYGQQGLEHVESARSLGLGRLVFGAHGDMSMDNAFCTQVILDSAHMLLSPSPKSSQYSIYPYLGIGVAKILDFSVMLPVYFDAIGKYDVTANKTWGGVQGGIGDLAVKLKLQVPPHNHSRVADLGLSLGADLPTGDKSHGYFPRHSYYYLRDSVQASINGDSLAGLSGFFSSGIPEFDGKILLTLNGWEHEQFTTLQVHLNGGMRILSQKGFDQQLLLGAGFEYRPAAWVGLFAEMNAEPRLANIITKFDPGKDPITLSPGFTLAPSGGLYFTVVADIGLSSQDPVRYASQYAVLSSRIQPALRIGGSIGWTGFLNRGWHGGEPSFPSAKSFDRDNDGIPDSIDKCPDAPEDKDGFEDADGCPDFDNDKDGIADSIDQCPNEPEDYDGFEDADGCPDVDNDKDGVCDPWVAEKGIQNQYEKSCAGSDRCPNLPEDIDGFEDADGCPDFDNDLDGIPDTLDKCPNEAGPADNGGCPKGATVQSQRSSHSAMVKEIRRGRLILKGVEFVQGASELTPESYTVIDNVYESLKAYPEVRVELAGYTDNVGNPLANKKLSLRRAEKVREYLVLHGIEAGRVTAVGKGAEDPVVDNMTPENRAFNRRIEMRRID